MVLRNAATDPEDWHTALLDIASGAQEADFGRRAFHRAVCGVPVVVGVTGEGLHRRATCAHRGCVTRAVRTLWVKA